MKSKSADITCDQTLVETDKVMKVSEFLGKSRIKKYFYVLSKISDEKKLKIIFSLIAQESLCVCDIAYILGCSIATASHLVSVLEPSAAPEPPHSEHFSTRSMVISLEQPNAASSKVKIIFF